MTVLDEARSELAALEGLSEWAGVTPCYYCGLPADTIDHVIPRHILESVAILGDPAVTAYYNRKHRIKTVPACRECNSLIGGKYFPTLAERKAYAKTQLRRHHRETLATGSWSDAELVDLEYALQTYVAGSVNAKTILLRRLAW